MTSTAFQISVVLSMTIAVAAAAIAAGSSKFVLSPWRAYRLWWKKRSVTDKLRWMESVPPVQIALVITAVGVATRFAYAPALAIALLAAAAPPLLLARRQAARMSRLVEQLDPMLSALANALSTTPNLGDALASIEGHLDSPMRDEVGQVLAETRLGKPLDEALLDMARRARAPGFEPAVAAAIMGRRTGGNLPTILESTARTLREISRLEGVVKTKTAEGRNQALVMGLVPPLLVAALHKIDPTWLEPMWRDPVGWILLGAAGVLEIAAIAMIRKIMAVDI